MSELFNKYNTKESVVLRKDQKDPLVMYLIINRDLNMSIGKTAAQAGHAVSILHNNYMELKLCMLAKIASGETDESLKGDVDYIKCTKFFLWQNDSFRKVVLGAKAKRWDKLKDKLECFVIRDAGLTEIESGSETCIGVMPMYKSERPNILRKLQTL